MGEELNVSEKAVTLVLIFLCMRNKIFFVIFFLNVAVSLFAKQGNRIPGQLIVQLSYSTSIEDFEKHLLEQNIITQNILPVSQRLNLWLIHFDEEQTDAQTMLQNINAMQEVETVQYNHILQNRNLPNDDDFILQWSMLNEGSGGTDDADIDADEAWNINTGGISWNGDSIIIAVIDEGFDIFHEDLRFQKNYAEIPGNATDDDANGFVDDYYGWDVTSQSDELPVFSHGTHVSGIAAAIGDNETGIAGINWNARVLAVSCVAIESEVLEAYGYVFVQREKYNTTNGDEGLYIVVSNTSFGIDNAFPDEFPLWCAMYDTLGKAGILSVGATTNGNNDVDVVGDIPTACTSDYLITVTNTNKFDQLISGGYGDTTIDMGAPGTAIYSTTAGNNYGTLTGTSMSSPHVAGAVALLMSDACIDFLNAYKDDPSLILLLKQYILESVDTLEDLVGKTVSEGRLNLYQALLRMNETYCANAIEENGNQLHAEIFPNPASTFLYVNIFDENYKNRNIKTELINMMGEKVIITNPAPAESLLSAGMHIQKLPAGTYLLRLLDENDQKLFADVIVIQ